MLVGCARLGFPHAEPGRPNFWTMAMSAASVSSCGGGVLAGVFRLAASAARLCRKVNGGAADHWSRYATVFVCVVVAAARRLRTRQCDKEDLAVFKQTVWGR